MQEASNCGISAKPNAAGRPIGKRERPLPGRASARDQLTRSTAWYVAGNDCKLSRFAILRRSQCVKEPSLEMLLQFFIGSVPYSCIFLYSTFGLRGSEP